MSTADLVINTLWAWMAAMGVSNQTGIVSPAYGVYRPIDSGVLLPRFADQLLPTQFYAKDDKRRSTGVNSSRLRLYPESFLGIPVLLPSPEEQASIVRFLDHANQKIDGFIRAKKRELSLITKMILTVTEKSLIKSDARVMRLSTAAELVHRPIERRAGETYTKIGLFNRGRGIFHKPPLFGAELGDSEFDWINRGDLVISGQFAWEGAVALARDKDQRCVASHRYPILRGREGLISSPALLAILLTKLGTTDGEEFELVVALIEAYERVAYPIDLPDPIEAIRFRMEQDGLNSKVDVDSDPISTSPLIKGEGVGG